MPTPGDFIRTDSKGRPVVMGYKKKPILQTTFLKQKAEKEKEQSEGGATESASSQGSQASKGSPETAKTHLSMDSDATVIVDTADDQKALEEQVSNLAVEQLVVEATQNPSVEIADTLATHGASEATIQEVLSQVPEMPVYVGAQMEVLETPLSSPEISQVPATPPPATQPTQLQAPTSVIGNLLMGTNAVGGAGMGLGYDVANLVTGDRDAEWFQKQVEKKQEEEQYAKKKFDIIEESNGQPQRRAVYHKFAIQMAFKDWTNPDWDTELTSSIMSYDTEKEDMLALMPQMKTELIVSLKTTMSDSKKAVRQEFIEVAQLWFCKQRQMKLGNRIPSYGITLGSLMASQRPNHPTIIEDKHDKEFQGNVLAGNVSLTGLEKPRSRLTMAWEKAMTSRGFPTPQNTTQKPVKDVGFITPDPIYPSVNIPMHLDDVF